MTTHGKPIATQNSSAEKLITTVTSHNPSSLKQTSHTPQTFVPTTV